MNTFLGFFLSLKESDIVSADDVIELFGFGGFPAMRQSNLATLARSRGDMIPQDHGRCGTVGCAGTDSYQRQG